MNKRAVCLTLLLGVVFSSVLLAEEMSLQDQINAIKEQISEQEELQNQLRTELSSKDDEIARLKEQLEELEKQIDK